jgi:hypothetical protein
MKASILLHIYYYCKTKKKEVEYYTLLPNLFLFYKILKVIASG